MFLPFPQKILKDIKETKIKEEDITEKLLYKYMYNDLGPLDFLIRTSGEERISNFMIYELSYAELYFTNTFFPDFNSEKFEEAIVEFNKRQRRFGGN